MYSTNKEGEELVTIQAQFPTVPLPLPKLFHLQQPRNAAAQWSSTSARCITNNEPTCTSTDPLRMVNWRGEEQSAGISQGENSLSPSIEREEKEIPAYRVKGKE